MSSSSNSSIGSHTPSSTLYSSHHQQALTPQAQLLEKLEKKVSKEALAKLIPEKNRDHFLAVLKPDDNGTASELKLDPYRVTKVFKNAVKSASSDVITYLYLKLVVGNENIHEYVHIVGDAIQDGNLQVLLAVKTLCASKGQEKLPSKVLQWHRLPSLNKLMIDHKQHGDQFLAALMDIIPDDCFKHWAKERLLSKALRSNETAQLKFTLELLKKYRPKQMPQLLKDVYRQSVLYRACAHENPEMAKVVLDHFHSFDKQTFRELLTQTSQVDVKLYWGGTYTRNNTAFHAAAQKGHHAILKRMLALLQVEDRPLLWRREAEASLLVMAAKSGCLKTFDCVLKSMSENQKKACLSAENLKSLLQTTVKSGNPATLDRLIKLLSDFQPSQDAISQVIPWSALAEDGSGKMLQTFKPLLKGVQPPSGKGFARAAQRGNVSFFKIGCQLLGNSWSSAITNAYVQQELLKKMTTAGSVEGLEFLFKLLNKDKAQFLNCNNIVHLMHWAVASGNPAMVTWIAKLLNDEELESVMLAKNGQGNNPLKESLGQSPEMVLAFKPLMPRLPTGCLGPGIAYPSTAHSLISWGILQSSETGLAVLELFQDHPKKKQLLELIIPALRVSLTTPGCQTLSLKFLDIVKKYPPEERKELIRMANPNGGIWGNMVQSAIGDEQGEVLKHIADIFTPAELSTLMTGPKLKYSPLGSLVKSKSGKELLPGIAAILKKLGAKERAALLVTDKYGDNLFHYAAMNGTVAYLFELLTQAELHLLMKANKSGNTPLHYAVAEAQALGGFKAMYKFLGDKLADELQRPNKDGATPLDQLFDTQFLDAFKLTLDMVKVSKLVPALTKQSDGSRPLILKIVSNGDLETIKKVFSNISKSDRQTLLQITHDGGNFLLKAAKQSRKGVFTALFSMLDDSEKLLAMKASGEGATPLHYLFQGQAYSGTQEVLNWLKTTDQTTRDHFKAEISRVSLFFILSGNKPGAAQRIVSFYKELGMNPLHSVTNKDFLGFSAVGMLILDSQDEALKQLLEIFKPSELAPCLLESIEGKPVLNPAKDKVRSVIAPLVAELSSAWDVARAYQPRMDNQGPLEKVLLKKYTSDELDRIALMHGVIYNKRVDLHSQENAGYKELLKPVYLELRKLQDKVQKSPTDELEAKFERMQTAVVMLLQALRAGKTDAQANGPMLPVLLRIPTFGDDSVRNAVGQFLARYPLSIGAPCHKWVPKPLQSRQAGLYLIPLHALSCKGVDKNLLYAIHLKLSTMGRRSFEGSISGKLLLLALVAIAQSDALTKEDTQRLLKLALAGKLEEDLKSIGQIIQMGMAHRLRSSALQATQPNFQNLANRCLQELIPVGEIKNFVSAYNRYVLSQRVPGSLTVYASRIAVIPETLKDLGQWVRSVLTGEFDKGARYSDQNNPHLAQVYKSCTRLRNALPKLVRDMKAFTLDEVHAGSQKVTFPMDQAKILELIGDGHLGLVDLPYLETFFMIQQGHDDLAYFSRLLKAQSDGKQLSTEQYLKRFSQEISALEKEIQSLSQSAINHGVELQRAKLKLAHKKLACEVLSLIQKGKKEEAKKLLPELRAKALSSVSMDLSLRILELKSAIKQSSNAQAKQREFDRLKLTQHLISLCSLGHKLESEQQKKKIDTAKVKNYVRSMAKQLALAVKKAEALGGTRGFLGEFANDLQSALTTYENSRKGSCDDFEVSLTDNYWDLFRIGSDVQGSCQRVDGAPGLNKCLLGYVMDGKTIPIVVRKPGSPNVIARRILRIELDQRDNKPVLFLERIYRNRNDKLIDDGIMEMARRTAKQLQLPLYMSSAPTYNHTATLQALQGPTHWVYSDAGGGAKSGGYQIADAYCIYMPKQKNSSSSSSSSSNSGQTN